MASYKAFRSNLLSSLPPDLSEIIICDTLRITHTELCKQPASWVRKYLAYIEGKTKAQNDTTREATKKH